METTEGECIAALREAAEALGESPTKAQYEDLGSTPASATIIRVMGGWNEAKRAAGLKTNTTTGDRVVPVPADLPFSEEEWREFTVDQRWHYRHSERNGRQTRDRRARLRAWVYECKRDSDGCARCGEPNPACLDFHHRDPDEKTMSVGKMVSYGYAKDEIRTEIEKCEILCANCHRIEHYEVPRGVEPYPVG